MSILEHLHQEVAYRKQEAVEILRYRYSDEEIKELCTKCIEASENDDLKGDLEKEGHPEESYFALVSLCCLMHLEKSIPPTSDYLLPAESAADLILTGFNAMLSLVEAGWKPAEKHATTRLEQLRNQPKTRHRENIEKNDLKDMYESFIDEKGAPPKNLDRFLAFLEGRGYFVDEVSRTVYMPADSVVAWHKPKRLGTIGNWLREFKNN